MTADATVLVLAVLGVDLAAGVSGFILSVFDFLEVD
jgi:hypothetical protein